MSKIEFELETISRHVVVNTTGINRSSNLGGISLEKYVIAIDAGRQLETGRMFRQKLEETFDLPIQYFVLTHRHTDHRHGAPVFKDCTFVCSNKTKEIMPKTFNITAYNLLTFEKELLIEEKDLLVKIIHVGGHTAGSSIVHFPNEKIVFSGDIILEEYPWLTYTGDNTCNFEEWIAALEFLDSLDVNIIVSGHGPMITKPQLKKHLELYYAFRDITIQGIRNNLRHESLELPDLEYIKDIKRLIPTLTPSQQKQCEQALLKGPRDTFKYLYKFYKAKGKDE